MRQVGNLSSDEIIAHSNVAAMVGRHKATYRHL